jgi:adenylate kinase family enzyme
MNTEWKIVSRVPAATSESTRTVSSRAQALDSVLADYGTRNDTVIRIEGPKGEVLDRAAIEREHKRRMNLDV